MASRKMYGEMKLPELRRELRNRGAKLSGRKNELTERLEAYDRNKNFGACSDDFPEYNMQLPDPLKYKDLNSDCKTVSVELNHVHSYLSGFDKVLDKVPIELYNEQYLCYIRMFLDEEMQCFYFRSACRAAMKKSVFYNIDVSISSESDILECQCEYGAGMGPGAHCKHVCAVPYALVMFSKNKFVNVENTCTEKLQSFHKVKKHTGLPVKMENVSMGSFHRNSVHFDPRPVGAPGTDPEEYQQYFRNVCLNFKGISQTPIFQIFEPANGRALAHDHDYFEKTPEDNFLEVFGLTSLTQKQAEGIELKTRGQGANSIWMDERRKRIQSSNFGRVCKMTEKTNREKLAFSMINQKDFISKATEHGRQNEDKAVSMYERTTNSSVTRCGIFVPQNMPFIGASPDGIVSDDILPEVKCSFTAKKKKLM